MAEPHDIEANLRPFPTIETAEPRLAYHEITDTKTSYRYGLTKDTFREHVSNLRQNRGKGWDFRITFDDGHLSQFTNALPILEHFSERAVFFITAGWTSKRSGYMSWNHLRELHERGYQVQSHGWSHALLTQCSLPILRSELTRSKNELEDHLGVQVEAISMPGGRWNAQVLRVCAAVGYTQVFTSDPWNATSFEGVRVIGRWMVNRNMGAEDVVTLLTGKGARVEFLRMKHRFKELGKSLIGDQVYQALWRSISNKNQSMEEIEQAYNSSQGNKIR